MRRLGRRIGLRGQLVLALTCVAVLGVGLSYLALYRDTGSRLRAQIDNDLRTQLAEWDQEIRRTSISTPAGLRRAAETFISAQRYHAASRVFVIGIDGGSPVTNAAAILRAETEREHPSGAPRTLLDAPSGLADVSVSGAGAMRVLSAPVSYGDKAVGVFHVADPLTPVAQAQDSMGRSFVVVGVTALIIAIAVAAGLAALIAAPLRRMTRVAADVEAGNLSTRAGDIAGSGDVQLLAETFDHMLERLQQSFQRQRDFVSDAAHELRTPLTILRMQVEVIDRQADPADREETTKPLLRRLDELDRLVADMLTLARAEAGQLIEPRTINLHLFFEDVRRDLPLFGERDFQLEAVDGTLDGDPDRLTQVLRNLLRNAVAHTKPNDTIAITARPLDGWLAISVSDTGSGIPPEQLEHIFERFLRLDRSRSRGREGAGLGLAIARAITEAHGGQIHAESEPGKGATFTIELPHYHSAPDQSGPRARRDSGQTVGKG